MTTLATRTTWARALFAAPHHPRRQRQHLNRRRLRAGPSLPVLGTALAVLAGCQGDGLQPAEPLERSALYWALDLNHHAVTLSISAPAKDTLTLVAVPRDVDGVALTGLPAAKYVSRNPDVVAVTEDAGGLQALRTTPIGEVVWVVATLTAGNLKHTDSVMVAVVDNPTPPVLDRFSIHPVSPDSAKTGPIFSGAVGLGPTCFQLPMTSSPSPWCTIFLPVTVHDVAGTPIPDVAVSIRSSSPRVLDVDPSGIVIAPYQGVPDTVKLYASTTVFGVRRTDTLLFRRGLNLLTRFDIRDALQFHNRNWPKEITIGTGGIVGWYWQVRANEPFDNEQPLDPVDITFSDPTNVAAVDLNQPPSFFATWQFFSCVIVGDTCASGDGNVVLDPASFPPIPPDVLRSDPYIAYRRFPVPGVYDYHSTALGLSGRIIVVRE